MLGGKRLGARAIGIAFGLSTAIAGVAHGQVDDASSAVVEVERALRLSTESLEAGDPTATLRFADRDDWIRTTSGEWLRGSIDWVRDHNMEFDSREFGALKINMRELAEAHVATSNAFLFDDRTSAVGPAIITAELVAVETAEGLVVRPRDELWGVVEGGVRERDNWSLVLDLGMSLNRGNSDQIDLNSRLDLTREDRRTLTQLGYILNLGFADRALNVSRHIGTFANRVYFGRRWFIHPLFGQLLSDRFQDIKFRAQPAAGGGIRALNVPSKALWDFSIGLGYQYLKLLNPFPTVKNPQHDGYVGLSTNARFDFTPDVYLTLMWVTKLTFPTIGNTNHTGIAELFFEVTNVLYLQAAFLFLRTEEQPPRFDGVIPKRNDYFLTIGVALQLG